MSRVQLVVYNQGPMKLAAFRDVDVTPETLKCKVSAYASERASRCGRARADNDVLSRRQKKLSTSDAPTRA